MAMKHNENHGLICYRDVDDLTSRHQVLGRPQLAMGVGPQGAMQRGEAGQGRRFVPGQVGHRAGDEVVAGAASSQARGAGGGGQGLFDGQAGGVKVGQFINQGPAMDHAQAAGVGAGDQAYADLGGATHHAAVVVEDAGDAATAGVVQAKNAGLFGLKAHRRPSGHPGDAPRREVGQVMLGHEKTMLDGVESGGDGEVDAVCTQAVGKGAQPSAAGGRHQGIQHDPVELRRTFHRGSGEIDDAGQHHLEVVDVATTSLHRHLGIGNAVDLVGHEGTVAAFAAQGPPGGAHLGQAGAHNLGAQRMIDAMPIARIPNQGDTRRAQRRQIAPAGGHEVSHAQIEVGAASL